jgi:hypothetical protein
LERLGSFLTEDAQLIADQIMTDWEIVGQLEPWHRIPPNLDQDHLPEMITAIADAALRTFFDHAERRDLAWVAARHGEHRASQGVSEEVLSREYQLLRWALWRRLKPKGSPAEASEAIIRIDSALTLAHGASLRGFHRPAIEQTGDWKKVMAEYIDQWSFPG